MTKSLEALIASEIADFFCGVVEIHTELGVPNTVEEAQQQLTERVTRIASECELALIAALEREISIREQNLSIKLHMVARIAELEAHPLCVKLPGRYPEGYGFVADIYNSALEECSEAIRAAGGAVAGSD